MDDVSRRRARLTDFTRSVWQSRGLRGFYSGLSPTLVGLSGTWALYFSTYENYKAQIAQATGKV